MSYVYKALPKSTASLEFTLTPEDIRPQLVRAAERLASERPIPGFRPGHASYDVVVSRYGEAAIYEAALPEVVRKAFVQAVTTEKLRTYGEPKISVGTLAPGNPLVFSVEVTLVPKVTSMPDPSTVTVTAKTISVPEADVDTAVTELAKMQTREVKVDRAAAGTDKLIVDLRLNKDGVPMADGVALNHGIYLGEDYYVPGFREQVTGLKAGDTKKFSLPFPADYHAKDLAGKDVEFDVTVKEIFELTPPAQDDAFAKSLGQESLAKLREVLATNMKTEAEEKEAQRQELAALNDLIAKAQFEDIPDLIITTEVDRMLQELQHEVTHRGMDWATYLSSLKKTADEIKLDMTPKALERIKVAILLREIGERENIETTDVELLEETTNRLNATTSDAKAQQEIQSDDYQDYLRTTLRNRKIIAWIMGKTKKA
jgi:trigger factor